MQTIELSVDTLSRHHPRAVQIAASDVYALYEPHKCERRYYLALQGMPQPAAGPYDDAVRQMGVLHEQRHLATFPLHVDLSEGSRVSRERRTVRAIESGADVLYHPALSASVKIGDTSCDIRGDPDFLIREGTGFIVRDCKVARRINEQDHPGILRQIYLYGFMFERAVGFPPLRLEVLAGTGDVVTAPYDADLAESTLREMTAVADSRNEPYSPVGWSKCQSCPYVDHCWQAAMNEKDVALLPGVDQNLARTLRGDGVRSIAELLARHTEATLSHVERPWGRRTQRVGRAAGPILLHAQAWNAGQVIPLKRPPLEERNYAVLDLEGFPPQLEDPDRVFIWGIKVFGASPSPYSAASLGRLDGERECWDQFLGIARTLRDKYGAIQIVHWAPYERVRLDASIERFGDPDGTATWVRGQLLDLLPIVKESVVLPVPTYGLKVIEQFIGFERSGSGQSGDWAMGMYIRALSTDDPGERRKIIDEVLRYNEEDLDATWAVLDWLRSLPWS